MHLLKPWLQLVSFFSNPIKLMHVEKKTPLGMTLVVLFGGSRLTPGSRGDALSRSLNVLH